MSRILRLRASPQAIAARFQSLAKRTSARRTGAFSPIPCIVYLAATLPTWAQSLEPVKPEQVGLSVERLDRIGQVFNREIDQGKLPRRCGARRAQRSRGVFRKLRLSR